jgi:hypothetical protein
VSVQKREKNARIELRLTDREKVRLRRMANNHGLSVGEFLRRLAFDETFRLTHARYEGMLAEKLRREGRL